MLSASHHGQIQLLGFQHQAQVQLEVGCVGDADEQVGTSFVGARAGHDIARDFFVGGNGVEAVGAGAGRAGVRCVRRPC